VEHDDTDPLREGRRRVLITGAAGQLGTALTAAFAGDDVVALTRARWDVTLPAPPDIELPELVLHAAAWTDVDGAEGDPQAAAAVNIGGVANVAALGAPLVVFSTDEAPRRGGGRGARVDRPDLVALRGDGGQLRAYDAAPRRRA
jgi:NAD(P)-dependent dehydrogenase (short-subunit alcohol dehydrogenase family)